MAKQRRTKEEKEVGELVKAARARGIATPPSQPVLATQDRITVRLLFNHEHHGEEPTIADLPFAKMLKTIEQPFKRRISVTPEPKSLKDYGNWINDAGFVIIQNRVGLGLQLQPSPEELDEMSKQIVRVTLSGSEKGLLIKPGRFNVFEPEDAQGLALASLSGTISVMLYVYPE